MSEQEHGIKKEEQQLWQELMLPHLLCTDAVQELHAKILNEWDPLRKSACQTAAGRALWKHLINDPFADLLAGETQLRGLYQKIKNDQLNNAREISGVILAVRTLWFDSKVEAAIASFREESQVVLLGAGMDARAYRLSCLKESNVFEVDFPEVLQVKASLLETAMTSIDKKQHPKITAKSLNRVSADIRSNDWFEKLQKSGFMPQKDTVWVLEVLLADFMNKPSTTMSNAVFHFYSDWPDQLLPSIGFSDVRLSQIGDPDAHFGLMDDPLNLFNKLRSLPRSIQTYPDDGKPCCRLYLVQASGLPNQTNQ
ncbi:Leucine carboxyl methyltransferase [Euphorbia peplus]|nr:Leucine carboxyl methyltransferase [Euphorbia peplus]